MARKNPKTSGAARPLSCVLYIRVSTKLQVEKGESIDAQRFELTRYAENHDMRMLMTQIDSLDPADRSYERKFNDLQRRLDDLYDRDAGLSDALEEAPPRSAWTESAGFWKSLTASPSCWKVRTSRHASTSSMKP